MSLTVKLQVFEGPLDLLLHLIEKNKVDIYDIPIVLITDQYLDYIRQMQREDLDVMSEFLVMAATLLDIKCIYEPYCDYPVALKVTMMNGTVQVYELKNKTEYQFDKVFEALEKLTVGYQYHEPIGKHERKIKPW